MKRIEFAMADFPNVSDAYLSENVDGGFCGFLKRDGFKTIQFVTEFDLAQPNSFRNTHSLSVEEYTWFILRWS